MGKGGKKDYGYSKKTDAELQARFDMLLEETLIDVPEDFYDEDILFDDPD